MNQTQYEKETKKHSLMLTVIAPMCKFGKGFINCTKKEKFMRRKWHELIDAQSAIDLGEDFFPEFNPLK